MAAYYNEFDKQKAAWLRELIACGLIAPGDVDERSIADVRPDDLRGYRQCHFFAGIGIWSYALRLAGWPDDREVWTGSCPCQPFSAAGKGEAFDDERHLWPEFFRLIEARRPVTCFGEQVSSIDGLAWFDVVHPDLEHADYTVGVLDTCAAGVGAPHRRQRLYWVADTELSGREPIAEYVPGGDRARTESRGARIELGDVLEPCRVADTAIPGHDGRRAGEAERRTGEPERLRDAGLLEDALRAERREDQRPFDRYRQAPRRDESADRAGERSEVERVDDSAGARPDGTVEGPERDSRDDARLRVSGERGPVNGFWRSADWVLTRPQRVGDRPGLRPVERGAQQMVDEPAGELGPGGHRGFPLAQKAEARVMRLRGYGDGIVAEQAAAFVRAYMELRGAA